MDNGPSNTKDFFASPALSLSLAGVFRNAAASVVDGVEETGGGYKGEIFEISSENTGNGRASDEEGDANGGAEENEEVGNKKKKKRKKHHRHTAEQIRVMEALFKESPHPDEKQRQQLSKQLGLAPRQVKFWFQNRRTQIKAIQERHETLLLKVEMEKLQEENQAMRGTINQACCPNCGSAMSSKDTTVAIELQQLHLENARLKAELQKLRGMRGRSREESASSSMCTSNDQNNRSSLDCYSGLFGLEKNQILEIVNHALDELTKMASANEPLWVRSVETGLEVLNYDEYVREFKPEISSIGQVKQSTEASREIDVVFLDVSRLIQAFMDVDRKAQINYTQSSLLGAKNQWKDMFPSIISQASTLDVILSGEGGNRNGAVQLMFAELQMLTPVVPTRELYFFRHCKQLSHDKWAILDVSIDKIEENIDASLMKCRKSPSGCIIEDKANGHCKVTWVEHIKCSKTAVPAMYRPIINNGLAYGAQHWLSTLQLQCERRVFFMATNVPSKDSNGVSTLAGRKSILRLAQRMTSSFCQAIGASRHHTWTKSLINGGEEIRFTTRKNIHDPGEPAGLILCVVSSTWLPISSMTLFDFLRNDSRRMEWDVMLNGGPLQTIASLVKGQNRRNSVTLHATKSTESRRMWVLQDSCTHAFESMLIYAPVDVAGMQAVVNGSDSSSTALLPSGFSILPDGLESRPLVITSRIKERNAEQGSLLTIAFQILANASPAAKLSMESVATVKTLISCTLHNIKRALQCEDG